MPESKTVDRVELPAEWREFLDALPGDAQHQGMRRQWTAEDDMLIVEGRKRGARWEDITKRLHCSVGVVRQRYLELINGK